MKEKILLFGTGKGVKKVLKSVDESQVDIVGFVDNDISKQSQMFEGKPVYAPNQIIQLQFDCIIICSVFYEEIFQQLYSMGVSIDKIKDKYYFHMQRFLRKYTSKEYDGDEEIERIVKHVKNNGLRVFNYPFDKVYNQQKIDVLYDENVSLYYVIYDNKKMYMAKKYDCVNKVQHYIRGILKEQDENSPHKYLTKTFGVKDGSVVIDAGVAEGNFALDIIDRVSKIYLVEMDDDWIEALKYTFEPYKNKVIIVKGFLSDKDEEGKITLDTIADGNRIDFIKMDIEGAESVALKGAKNLLSQDNIKVDVCIYHNIGDQQSIEDILSCFDFNIEYSTGYMAFMSEDTFQSKDTISLVKGLIRAWK